MSRFILSTFWVPHFKNKNKIDLQNIIWNTSSVRGI